jgi:hypothetical protein
MHASRFSTDGDFQSEARMLSFDDSRKYRESLTSENPRPEVVGAIAFCEFQKPSSRNIWQARMVSPSKSKYLKEPSVGGSPRSGKTEQFSNLPKLPYNTNVRIARRINASQTGHAS